MWGRKLQQLLGKGIAREPSATYHLPWENAFAGTPLFDPQQSDGLDPRWVNSHGQLSRGTLELGTLVAMQVEETKPEREYFSMARNRDWVGDGSGKSQRFPVEQHKQESKEAQ